MIVYGVDVTKHHQDIFHKHPFEILLENLKGIIFDKGIRKYYTILNIQNKILHMWEVIGIPWQQRQYIC